MGETTTQEATQSASFDLFDREMSQVAASTTQSVQTSPNKNQTVIGKKELQRLRRKADQFNTLLNKAKALKEKNKEIKDEMTALESIKEEFERLKAENKSMKMQVTELETTVDNQQFGL